MSPKREKPPTIDVNSPLQRGHRWVWVPVLVGTFISVVTTIVTAIIDK